MRRAQDIMVCAEDVRTLCGSNRMQAEPWSSLVVARVPVMWSDPGAIP